MPERQASRPDVLSDVDRTAGTMFAALYGDMTPHPWLEPSAEPGLHVGFHDRSVAMGWLDDRSTGEARRASGLWAVNDAGRGRPQDGTVTSLTSWFQVEVSAVASDRPLPVQPMLACGQAATSRTGTLRLTGVQVLLPLQGLDPSARAPYAPVPAMRTVGWFTGSDPSARTAVLVDVDTGQDPSAATVARRLVDDLTRLDQDVFTYRSHDTTDRRGVPPPPFDDSHWNGPALHGVTLHGDLAEWSCEAVGWLAEVVADCLSRSGLRAPVLFTATRA